MPKPIIVRAISGLAAVDVGDGDKGDVGGEGRGRDFKAIAKKQNHLRLDIVEVKGKSGEVVAEGAGDGGRGVVEVAGGFELADAGAGDKGGREPLAVEREDDRVKRRVGQGSGDDRE